MLELILWSIVAVGSVICFVLVIIEIRLTIEIEHRLDRLYSLHRNIEKSYIRASYSPSPSPSPSPAPDEDDDEWV